MAVAALLLSTSPGVLSDSKHPFNTLLNVSDHNVVDESGLARVYYNIIIICVT